MRYGSYLVYLSTLQGLVERFPLIYKRKNGAHWNSLIYHLNDGKDKHSKFIFPSNFI